MCCCYAHGKTVKQSKSEDRRSFFWSSSFTVNDFEFLRQNFFGQNRYGRYGQYVHNCFCVARQLHLWYCVVLTQNPFKVYRWMGENVLGHVSLHASCTNMLFSPKKCVHSAVNLHVHIVLWNLVSISGN